MAAGTAVAAAPRQWKRSESRVYGIRDTVGRQVVPFGILPLSYWWYPYSSGLVGSLPQGDTVWNLGLQRSTGLWGFRLGLCSSAHIFYSS